jgi:hypothetical protein
MLNRDFVSSEDIKDHSDAFELVIFSALNEGEGDEAFLAGKTGDEVVIARSLVFDEGSAFFWAVAIKYLKRNAFLHKRDDCLGMENLGSSIRELS